MGQKETRKATTSLFRFDPLSGFFGCSRPLENRVTSCHVSQLSPVFVRGVHTASVEHVKSSQEHSPITR